MATYTPGALVGADLFIKAGQYLPPPSSITLINPIVGSRDQIDGGKLSISGPVVIEGTPEVPVARRVRLHDYKSGRLVREMWSDPITGAYAFTNIRAGTYYVVSTDHTGVFNAVIRDRVEAA